MIKRLFTTPCFIQRNSAFLRNELADMGYVDYWRDASYPSNNVLVVCSNEIIINSGEISSRYTGFPNSPALRELLSYNYIDCGINTDLFLALAALRNDSDYKQYFKGRNSGYIIQCMENSIANYKPETLKNEIFDKMTVDDLIKYFS